MSNKQVRKVKKTVAQELRRIYRQKDGLRPSEVVEAARPKDSPLHSEFEWNDKKAGHEHRLWQARQLIRVTVIETTDPDKPDRYVHVPATLTEAKENESGEGVYHPMSVVVQDVDQFTRALGELTMKMRVAIRAAEELREAAETNDNPDKERMARIALALTALKTAGAAVEALH